MNLHEGANKLQRDTINRVTLDCRSRAFRITKHTFFHSVCQIEVRFCLRSAFDSNYLISFIKQTHTTLFIDKYNKFRH